jgi:large subunit ribosomal protein L2
MPLRNYKPTSPGLRQMTRSTFEEITTKEPYKPLLEPQKRGSGRNNQGRL